MFVAIIIIYLLQKTENVFQSTSIIKIYTFTGNTKFSTEVITKKRVEVRQFRIPRLNNKYLKNIALIIRTEKISTSKTSFNIIT